MTNQASSFKIANNSSIANDPSSRGKHISAAKLTSGTEEDNILKSQRSNQTIDQNEQNELE